MRVGVLHTVPALVPVFHALLTERRSDLDIVHTADPALLRHAIEDGIDEAVSTALRGHLRALAEAGARAVLVTCSSIGEAALAAAPENGVRVVRVDAAMADEAIARARRGTGRVLVLATLAATLGPTTRLVQAAAAGEAIEISAHVVADAASALSGGDQARHDRLVAEAIASAGAVDAIVLAQASMATGAGDDDRVFTSPLSGSTAFVDSLGAFA